jgi:hypothetical protein
MSAEIVAAKTGLPPEQVFKTLAAGGPEWNLLNVISANPELTFKPLANQTGPNTFLAKAGFSFHEELSHHSLQRRVLSHTATPIQLLMTSDWRGARCARPSCDVEEGCGRRTPHARPTFKSSAVRPTRRSRVLQS